MLSTKHRGWGTNIDWFAEAVTAGALGWNHDPAATLAVCVITVEAKICSKKEIFKVMMRAAIDSWHFYIHYVYLALCSSERKE